MAQLPLTVNDSLTQAEIDAEATGVEARRDRSGVRWYVRSREALLQARPEAMPPDVLRCVAWDSSGWSWDGRLFFIDIDRTGNDTYGFGLPPGAPAWFALAWQDWQARHPLMAERRP